METLYKSHSNYLSLSLTNPDLHTPNSNGRYRNKDVKNIEEGSTTMHIYRVQYRIELFTISNTTNLVKIKKTLLNIFSSTSSKFMIVCEI